MNIAPSAAPRRALGLAVAATLLAGCSQSEDPSAATSPAPAASATPAATTTAATTTRGSEFDFTTWDQSLGGNDSSQYSSLDQINRGNVNQLEVAWSYVYDGNAPNFNPLVVEGVMYVLAQFPRPETPAYVALNAATGEEIWRSPIEGQVGSRGMSYWESDDGSDRRLIFLNSGMMSEIDADTGEPITSFGDNGKVDMRIGYEYDIDSMPILQHNNPGRVFEDIAIFSLPARNRPGGNYNAYPADVHAYNILTGELEWVFHNVPREGDFGADTWPAEGLGGYGGVHNWSEFTVDEDLGIAYIPTGTARFDFYGGNRLGDNLFGNTLLALDARTGERLWHFQIIHHDLWDYDNPQAPKLLTLNHDGEEVKAVAQATKQGLLFVFNRETGEPVWPIEEQPMPASDIQGEVASPTQPIPTRPPPFARRSFTVADINPYITPEEQATIRENLTSVWRNEGPYTPPSLEGSISMPGHNGGTNWGGSAVDPANGRFFVVSKELPTLDTLFPPGAGGRGGGGGRGGRGGQDDGGPPPPIPGAGADFIPYASPVNFMQQSNSLSAIGPPWSQLTAYDLDSGEILWQVPNGGVYELMQQGIENTGAHAPRGGPVVTAGGLVFVATSSDRKFRARNTDTGEVLWEYDLPAGSDGVPAVYAVDGREYVALPVGGNGLFSNNLTIPPPGPSQYMVFALPQN